MYRVRIERKVQKKLSKIADPYYSHMKAAILDLGNDPRPKGSKKLKSRDGFRIRVGDYRIIYDVYDSVFVVDIIDLGHRKDIYK